MTINEMFLLHTRSPTGETTCSPSSPGQVYSLLEDLYGTEGVSAVWFLEDTVSKECRIYAHEDGQLRRTGWLEFTGGTRRTPICGPDPSGDHSLVPNPEDTGQEVK